MDNISTNENLHNTESQKGYIQVYTGDGKGKTTASLGLAMRALGRGWRVLIVMFTKGGNDYGELVSFSELSGSIKSNLKIVQAGLDRIVYSKNCSEEDKKLVQEGWIFAKNAIKNNEYDLVILDEANIALNLELIDLQEMLETLKNKPTGMEIVLTGRKAKQEITDIAHLVSRIEPQKHYFTLGVQARKGIEY